MGDLAKKKLLKKSMVIHIHLLVAKDNETFGEIDNENLRRTNL